MKHKTIILIFALIISSNIFAENTENKEVFYMPPETMPQFPGGESALMDFVNKNIRNPTNSQGRVIVQFVIDRQGKVINPEIVRSVSTELDNEALRIVSLMPTWTPGLQFGTNPVSVKYTLPINFKSSEVTSTQNSEKTVENIITNISKSVISADFSLEETGKNVYSTSGKFILKNEKFMVEMPEMKIWFDGKTMWSYASQINEVSITEPDKTELATINPLLLIKAVNETSTKTQTNKGKNTTIVFTPKTGKADFEKIELSVETSTNNPTKIEIFGKDKSRMIFEMTNYKSEKNISDNTFVFNKNEYKGVFVNDLR